MSNVYVLDIGIPRTPRNGRNLQGIGGNSFTSITSGIGTTAPTISITPKEVILFTDIEIPILIDYQTNYAAKHGEYPSVRCWIDVDATTGYELQQMPQFTYINGLIDTIWFYPDQGAISGKIILQ